MYIHGVYFIIQLLSSFKSSLCSKIVVTKDVKDEDCYYGKTSFMSTFFQYASFIVGGIDPPGSIGESFLDSQSTAILSFRRLVGCAYFRKHSTAFELHTPEALFHSIECNSMTEQTS